MMSPDAEGLVLDARSHRYTWCGQRVGGVSEIMQALGIVDPRWYTDYSRERGTAVHLALDLLAHGRLDWSSVDSRVAGYVRAGEKFLLDFRVPIGTSRVLTEHMIYHEGLRYAGKLDLFTEIFDAEEALIDFKTGGLGCAGMQTAAYEGALRLERGAKKPARRIAVQLFDDGRYKKFDMQDSRDYQLWAACCMLFNTFHVNRRD